MAKKKIIRAEDITEKDILSLYEDVLPLLFNNPENIDISYVLNRRMLEFVQYDFGHYVVDEPHEPVFPGRLRTTFENWGERGSEKDFSDISLVSVNNKNADASFEELVEDNYQKAIERKRVLNPAHREYHYHRIVSDEKPKIVLGFFRDKSKTNDNSFTKEEIKIFEKITPNIFLLFRTITSFAYQSRTYQYFNTYMEISAKLVQQYALSDTESKFLPEILFGRTNEEIAERYFVSVAAIKKHIKHIFKKTGTKNRIDFISKFFTSPDRITL